MNIHDFFYFLGTPPGDLTKKFVELLFFVLVTYMVVSEHQRERTRELKYLSLAFGMLAMQKLLATAYLFSTIYSSLPFRMLDYVMPIIENGLEIIGLVLLASAFIYPYYKGNLHTLRRYIQVLLLMAIILTLIVQVLWLLELLGSPGKYFFEFSGSLIFILAKMLVLTFPIIYLSFITKTGFNSIRNLVIAYATYLVVPILAFINFIFFSNASGQIFVAQHPFPLLSVLMFTRVIYLKLVNKATLKDRLKLSEEKYRAERELSKMKDEFVSVVSHELRTPITSMKLYTDLLEKGKFGSMNIKQKKAMKIIKEETNRLVVLVNDVLDLSKLESGKAQLRIADFDFGSYCKDNLHYTLARQKGLRVINKVRPGFKLRVDPDKFRQVFINLLTNAIKYTNKGSITISASEHKDRWEIRIKDTGVGIEQGKLPRLFDKFYVVEDFLTRKERGIGLGLAIVKKIIELHSGRIDVESEPGKGSTFIVTMPKDISKTIAA
ncbi:HAMP domain-containing histidine kinase [Candidatus Woesearchaeota archaeon]|nr:HAMP domain-containing histidine kinase [Candidatus Woesearchaeota archaeon]